MNKRYTIHPCANERQDLAHADIIGTADDATDAKRIADDNAGLTYGTCIRDNETGLVDFGAGFGVALSPLADPEE
jgi:hypothetical protein